MGISRPLLQVHLRRLTEARLVAASLELSADGKAMKYYEVVPFNICLTPDTVAAAAQTLALDGTVGGGARAIDCLRDPVGLMQPTVLY